MMPLLGDDDAETVFSAAIAVYRQTQSSQIPLGVQDNSHSGLIRCVARCLGKQLPVCEGDCGSIQPYIQSRSGWGSDIILSVLYEQSPVNWDAMIWLWKHGESDMIMGRLEFSKEPLPPQLVANHVA
jgi:hypothetical protein